MWSALTSSQQYRPSSLSLRKGKWYVSVTKPKELQFGRDRQARRSTGTRDRKQAALLQHQLTQEIYDSFDEALGRTDKFFEAVRPELEAQGFKAKDWYGLGYVESFKQPIIDMFGKVRRMRKRLTSHLDILKHLKMIDVGLLDLLPDEERSEALELAIPKPLTAAEVFKLAHDPRMNPEVLGRVINQRNRRGRIRMKGGEKPLENLGTLKDVLDRYLQEDRKPHQRKHATVMLGHWLTGAFADKPLGEVSRFDAYEFLSDFAEDRKNATVKGLKAALSNVWEWALLRRDLGVQSNPFAGLKLKGLGEDATERRTFTPEELHALFALDLTEAERDAFAIMVTTGIRVESELLAAREAVKVDGVRCVDLRKSEVKTKSSKRLVPIHPAIDPVFPLATTRASLREIVRQVSDDPTLTNHSLRHTFIDLARDAGVDWELRMFITGHAIGREGGKYGQGPSAQTRMDAITSIPHPWLKREVKRAPA